MSVSVNQRVLAGFPGAPPQPQSTAVPAPRSAEPAARQYDIRQTTASNSAATMRLFFVLASLAALGFGWWLAANETFTPKDGAGYWIGIAGGTILLLQLAYPLRKRARFMRRIGSAPLWFRLHMVLGIVGPLLILYHSNYSLGAPNSNVALMAMLVVAASGIIGRYFYGKVHNGLYGAHSNLQDLLEDATALLKVIENDTGGSGGAVAMKLTSFGEEVLRPRRSATAALVKALQIACIMPFVRMQMLREIGDAIAYNTVRLSWSATERNSHYGAAKIHLHNYLDAVVKASGLALYDKLFAMWHLLHLPLYFLLIVTGIVHVVAVHLY